MAEYLNKSKLFLIYKGGKFLPVDYCYGPWDTIAQAWTALAGSATAATTKIAQGTVIAYKDATDGNKVKELQLVKPMPDGGYTITNLLSKPVSSNAQEKSETAETNNSGEIAAGDNNKSTEKTETTPGTVISSGCGTETLKANGFETLSDGTVYIKGVGGYDGTNPTTGTNDVKSFLDTIDGVEKTDEGGYKTEGASSAENNAFAEGTNTQADADSSHAEGVGTKTSNQGEHAEGTYNVTTSDKTISSTGIGTSDTDRKNVVEKHIDGTVYIKGLGTYDGTNALAGTNDVVTVLKDKEDVYEVIDFNDNDEFPTNITRNTVLQYTFAPTAIDLSGTTTNDKELVLMFDTTDATTMPTITLGSNRYVGDIPTFATNSYYVMVVFKGTAVIAERKVKS